jgi:hypothetical protein
MAEQMEQIDVEEIMQEIRTQIKERGYTKNDLRFADVNPNSVTYLEEIDEYFELTNFGQTVEKMNGSRKVQCWRPLAGNKIAVFIKKIIRKLTKFYVEPIIRDQNQFNFYTTSAMSQLYAKIEDEQAVKMEEMQRQIETLEQRIRQLEEKCGE